MAYCLPTCPKFCCKFKFVPLSTCPHHCQKICQLSCPAHCCAPQHVSTMEQSQSIQESCPTICSSSCLTIIPIFCCMVPPLKPSSCPSSCSVSCILPCQQHCCQECYLSITKCNSLWRHVPGAPLSCLIWTIVIFNKIFNTNRKCLSQTFCCGKAMKHLHHMPQFLLIILFTQLAPGIVAWDMTKVSCSPRSWL